MKVIPEVTVLDNAKQIMRAAELISLGARLQLVEAKLPLLPRNRLVRLYREITGVPPPRGMLPFSGDWFLTWHPNVQVSFLAACYQRLEAQNDGLDRIDLLLKSYQLYAEHFSLLNQPILLDITRAWTFLRYRRANVLSVTRCACCSGVFVIKPGGPRMQKLCSLCKIPSRILGCSCQQIGQ